MVSNVSRVWKSDETLALVFEIVLQTFFSLVFGGRCIYASVYPVRHVSYQESFRCGYYLFDRFLSVSVLHIGCWASFFHLLLIAWDRFVTI